MCGRWQLCLC
uniref:Uncharacterized protein n=1 Tax=Anguilla anguilla TaxID=7936 RepID=A0A0E9TDV6_ANGAN